MNKEQRDESLRTFLAAMRDPAFATHPDAKDEAIADAVAALVSDALDNLERIATALEKIAQNLDPT